MGGLGGPADNSERRRRLLGRVGLIVYAMGLVGLFAYAAREQPLKGRAQLETHTDKRLGIAVKFPADWHVWSFNRRIGLGDHVGFVLANSNVHLEHPDLPPNTETQVWDMTGFPDDTVVLEYSLNARFAGMQCEPPYDELPLDLAGFELVNDSPSYGNPPRLWYPPCFEGADMMVVHMWAFPEASEADVAAAKDSIRSMKLTSTK